MLQSMRSKAQDAGEALMLELILARPGGGLQALLPALARTGVAVPLEPCAVSAPACGDSSGLTGTAAVPNNPGNYEESSMTPVTEDDEQGRPYYNQEHVWRGSVEVRQRLKIIPPFTRSAVPPQHTGGSGSSPFGVKSEDYDSSCDSPDDLMMSASDLTLDMNSSVDKSLAMNNIEEASAVNDLPPTQQNGKDAFSPVSDDTSETRSEEPQTPKQEETAKMTSNGAGHGVVGNGGEDNVPAVTPDIDRKNGTPTLVAGVAQEGQQPPLYMPDEKPGAAATVTSAERANGKSKHPAKRSGWWFSKLFGFGKDEKN